MTDTSNQAHEPGSDDRQARKDAGQADDMPTHSPLAPTPPKDHKAPMRHDLTGEFDYGIEGGQTQDHGPDRTDGTPPAKH